MRGTLIIAILTVKSSYAQEVEVPLDGPSDVPDTLQWWIADGHAWRIKTFALDHDIHMHSMDRGGQSLIATAKANNLKHYGDVIASQYELVFDDCENKDDVKRVFAEIGLRPLIEVSPGQFAFWKPDNAKYRTQSTPK